MIKKVCIEGFQSHVKTNIEFHPHLNVIVGPTNSGKSAILRALKKVIRDSPSGNNFINKNLSTCEITVENDSQIKRRVGRDSKGNTKTNQYRVNDDQPFSSFGTEIPQEVIDALDMSIINFGDKLKLDLHFANQHAQPFLLDETASVKSKVLGRISGLNVIDGAIQTVKTETRQSTSTLKVVDKDIEQLNTELQELPDVSTLEIQADTFEKKLDNIERQCNQLEQLRILDSQVTDITSLGNTLRNELESLPNLDDLNFDVVRAKISEHTQLKKLSKNLDDVNAQIDILEKDPVLGITVTLDNFESVKSKIVQKSKLTQLDLELVRKDNLIYQLDVELQRIHYDWDDTKQKWEQLLKELGVCPTCKQSTVGVKFENL